MSVRRLEALLLAILLTAPGGAAWSKSYKVSVRGGESASFLPEDPKAEPAKDSRRYDVVIVGGGLAGMTAASYLSDHGKSVLLLEKEEVLGGIAAGGMLYSGVPFNRGVAYWTDSTEEQMKILEHIGMGGYRDRHAIPEPTDSYFWKGKLYLGIWEEETLHQLPASFALFKSELQRADKGGLIPNQPFEEGAHLELDAFNAAEWIRAMPEAAAARTDEEAKKVYARFSEDKSILLEDPMRDVVDLMDLYCRSALGGNANQVSAAAFANFYISEIATRYTTPLGTGEAASLIERILRQRGHLVDIRLKAAARSVRQDAGGVEVLYLQKGKARAARAAHAVFAAQLKFAADIVEGLAASERGQALRDLAYSHYSVHVVVTKGHPYRATFDTWTRASDYTERDFPDVILGRWMDPVIKGYEGMRDHKQDPKDDQGILTIYHPFSHPLGLKPRESKWEREHVAEVARQAVARLIDLYSPLLKERWGTKIEVRSVETNRWPFSIHVAKPGHFTRLAKELRKPYGRVFFANNNLGTPSFEEALFRGHCAANNILKRLDPGFAQEPWSKCPLE